MDEVVLAAAEAHELVMRALEASNTSMPNAKSVADALIGAELCGQSGHGLRRVVAYAAQARAGKVDGLAMPEMQMPRPGTLWIDAANGFAFPALDLAIVELHRIAPAQGIAIACVCRSHHAGVAGLTVERLAELGLVALMFTNSPPAIAPWGSSKALFGTNPIAFACPAGDNGPIVVDVSMSKVARGRIMAASQKNEPIPEGWALDARGKPTTDASAGLGGTMVPIGEAKGTALALMVELLAAGLSGANFAIDQSSFFDTRGGPPGTGQAVIAIDPLAFGGDAAVERFSRLADMVAASDGARLPGARRHQLRAKMLAEGIRVERKLLEEILRLGNSA